MSGWDSVFNIETDDFERLLSAMEEYGDGALEALNEVIHSSGADIYEAIDPLIHSSGRTFKGHSSGAKGSHWQRYDTDEDLVITVGTTGSRHYLYFPDDGSNTKRHYGDQQFMRRGAEAAAPLIIEKGMEALIAKFERS